MVKETIGALMLTWTRGRYCMRVIGELARPEACRPVGKPSCGKPQPGYRLPRSRI